jgi:hypothetical protein
MSFLGAYDRELDSDDEDLSFEEQFILRLPPGEDLEKLRKMVTAREVSNDVWFKFKGVFRCQLYYYKPTHRDVSSNRLETRGIPYRQQSILNQTRRPTMYHRVPEDLGQQTDVQDRRHMPG